MENSKQKSELKQQDNDIDKVFAKEIEEENRMKGIMEDPEEFNHFKNILATFFNYKVKKNR